MQAGARIELTLARNTHGFQPVEIAKPVNRRGRALGRTPGWHIECSAMSMLHLGEQLDIHGAGTIIFRTMRTRSLRARVTPQRFVRYWLHNALLKLPGRREDDRHSAT